jgi:hypothetical protein
MVAPRRATVVDLGSYSICRRGARFNGWRANQDLRRGGMVRVFDAGAESRSSARITEAASRTPLDSRTLGLYNRTVRLPQMTRTSLPARCIGHLPRSKIGTEGIRSSSFRETIAPGGIWASERSREAASSRHLASWRHGAPGQASIAHPWAPRHKGKPPWSKIWCSLQGACRAPEGPAPGALR